MDLSSAELIRNLPFGWNQRSVTQLSWPASVIINLPDLTSNILIFLSLAPVAMNYLRLLASISFSSYNVVSIVID